MIRSGNLRPLVLFAWLILAGCAISPENPDAVQTADAARAEIWEKELAIFTGRGQGDISNYLNVASGEYLGWPPVLPSPTSLDSLRASADQAIALRGEVSNLTQKGFTLSGDTALMYFLNHRTRLGEGMADEAQRDVSEYYENVHVWVRRDGQWQLVGGFARKLDAPRE
ncbi:MAG: hypothetical protein AAGA23_22695 [Pseudomonadota bacterium]